MQEDIFIPIFKYRGEFTLYNVFGNCLSAMFDPSFRGACRGIAFVQFYSNEYLVTTHCT